MRNLIILQVILQALIPIALLAWLGFGRESNRAGWFVKALLVAVYLVAIARAGLWLALPWYLPRVYGFLWLAAIALSWRKLEDLPIRPARKLAWLRLSTLDLAATLSVLLAAYSIAGHIAPNRPIAELRFPLDGGTYAVAGGGSNGLLNPHLSKMRQPRFRAFHGQSWGLDIVKLGAWGSRKSGIAPQDPARYAIFGEAVVAPCSGGIVNAVDGLPDLHPPDRDRKNPAGNHIVIACSDLWIVLGHLQQGSVRVRVGDQIVEGQQVGRVGNSGNSDEPHLHIHAQTPGTLAAPLSGNPVPIRLDGRFLARNDRIERDNLLFVQAGR